MKRRFFTVGVVCAIVASLSLSSCIGSFSLTKKLLTWNEGVGHKFVNELVFVAFWVLPVYEVCALADILVLNSVEFWSGHSPLAANSTIVDGQDGKYLVERDATGYTITSFNDQTKVRLDFNEESQTWSLVGQSGTVYPLMTFVDVDHVKVNVGGGEMMLVERNEDGLYALQAAVAANARDLALAK